MILSGQVVKGYLRAGCTKVSTKFPYCTSTLTGGSIAMAGDVAVQQCEGGDGINWRRAWNMFIFRTCIFGPQYILFLKGMEKYIKFAEPTFAKTIASKVFLDQLLFSPIAIAQFYLVLTLLDGGSLKEGLDKCCELGGQTLLVGWSVWCPVQALTFSIIPINLRFQFVSGIQAGWNGWLSLVNSRADKVSV